MVHTAELRTKIGKEEYYNLINSKNFMRSQKKKNCYNCFKLASFGIRKIEIRQTKIPYNVINAHQYSATIIINLTRVANGGKRTVELFTLDKTIPLYDNFAKFIEPYFAERTDLNCWTLSRIDYTMDIETEYVAEYIELLQNGRTPSSMDIPDTLDLQKKKPINRTHPYDTSVIYENKSNKVNFYNKFEERKADIKKRHPNQEPTIEELKELELCKNVLRLEIQVLSPKLRYIDRKNDTYDRHLINFLCDEKAHEKLILQKVEQISGTSDYFKYSTALKKIENLPNIKIDKRERMKLVFKKVNRECKSVRRALVKYPNIKPYLKAIDKNGINNKAISETMAKKIKAKCLPNVLKLAEKQNFGETHLNKVKNSI